MPFGGGGSGGSGNPIGPAGGDLTGTYPNPNVGTVLGGAYPAVIAGAITTITTTYPVADTDDVILATGNTSYTVTLPNAAGTDTLRPGHTRAGRRFTIKRMGGGAITIASAGGSLLMATGGTGHTVLNNFCNQVTYQSDGTNWNEIDVIWPTFGPTSALYGALTPALIAQTFDPLVSGNTQKALAAATRFVCKLEIPVTVTITNLLCAVSTVGTNYSGAQMGLYRDDGNGTSATFLGATVAQSNGGPNGYGTLGLLSLPITGGPFVVQGGPNSFVWIADQVQVVTAGPSILSANAGTAALTNLGLPTGNMRNASNGGSAVSDLATLSNLALGSNVAVGPVPWHGIA